MISSARSSTPMCCITVQRSKAPSNRSHKSPVVRGASLSRSRICRRRESARALKIRSSLSGVDMLYFYNLSSGQSNGGRADGAEIPGAAEDPEAGGGGLRRGRKPHEAERLFRADGERAAGRGRDGEVEVPRGFRGL